MKQHKTHVYQEIPFPCDYPGCERVLKTAQGLLGHRRLYHNSQDKTIPDPKVIEEQVSSEETIKVLRNEVSQLKLEKEKRQLTAELPSTKNEAQDLMQQLGLGNFDPEVKAAVQRRAVSLASSDQGQAPGWLDKILSSPGGLQAIIEGVKGVLGVSHNNEGSNGLGILKELGIDLKQLWERSQAPRGDSSFKVGGISLDGVSLTPEVWSSLIQFKAAEDNLAYQKAKDGAMADGLQSIIKIVTDSGILGRLGGGMAKGPGRNSGIISQEIMPGSEPAGFKPFTCPKCGHKNQLPEHLVPGMEVHCEGQGCDQVWTVYDEGAQPKPQRQVEKKQVEVKPPIVEETPCPGCAQLINLDGRTIGEIVKCPACQNELTISSETLAAKAQDLTELEKGKKQFLRNGYG